MVGDRRTAVRAVALPDSHVVTSELTNCAIQLFTAHPIVRAAPAVTPRDEYSDPGTAAEAGGPSRASAHHSSPTRRLRPRGR